MNYKINIYDRWNVDIILKIEIRSISQKKFNDFITDIKLQTRDQSSKKEHCIIDSMAVNNIPHEKLYGKDICFSTKDIKKLFNYDCGCECLTLKSLCLDDDDNDDEVIIRSNQVKFMITTSNVLNVSVSNDYFELSDTYLTKDEILDIFKEMFLKHLKGKDLRILLKSNIEEETQEKFIG